MADYSDLAYALGGYGKKASPYDARRKYGYDLIKQGSDTSPVQSPWQGAARLAQALAGGLDLYTADRDEKAADKKRSDALAQAMAEPDPQKRIGLLAAYDPDAGARAAGQLAVEQAKIQEQGKTLQAGAGNFGAGFGVSPQAAAGPLPQGAAPSMPGGFANNSGNIRSTAPGNYNGFATYPTPEAGASAHFGNFQAYVQQNPNITVAQAIAKWSPPNENQTQGIIKQISEATGINPGMPLAEVLKDPAVAATLLDAQTRLEKGGLPQGFTADTFMQATTPRAPQASGPPTQLAAPGVPGPIASPPQMAQGDNVGMPPAPNPAQVGGPAVIAPPGIPDVPRPQPSPQQLAQYQARIRSGEFGTNPQEAFSRARAALDADIDRQWGVDRERAKMGFEQQQGDYTARRNKEMNQPQEAFQNESKLRSEFETQPAVKSFRTVVPMLESAKDAASRPTRAADLNLVYAFAKLMDPDSVVRESETGAVVATQSVADRLQSYIGQLNGQAMLNPEVRAKLIAELDSRYNAIKASHDALAENYAGIAKAHNIAPERVVIPIRTGREGTAASGNQPSQDELSRWATGGGAGKPVRIGLDGRPR